MVNHEARRLLDIGEDGVGRPVSELGLPDALTLVLRHGRQAGHPLASVGRRLLLSSGAVFRNGQAAATDALLAQAHEAANRLHIVTTLIEVGRPDEAAALATAELRASREVRAQVLGAVEDPGVSALLVGKAAQAAERDIEFELDPDAHLPLGALPAREAVLILGKLTDNALDATAAVPLGGERPVTVDAQVRLGQTVLTVAIPAPASRRMRSSTSSSAGGPPNSVGSVHTGVSGSPW